ncbi:hypothetical protein [Streptomyces sp. NPDC005078]|uniref:hypothetical protein n=1 Tax=unclassified Streptomyces TaxID=2593676 RepID=UPI0033B65DAA
MSEAEQGGSGSWLPRWRRAGAERSDNASNSVQSPVVASGADSGNETVLPREVAPGVLTTGGAGTNLHGNVDVVAAHVQNLIMETRKRDVLEGVELNRSHILGQPFIREAQWAKAWEEALDPKTERPRQRVLIVVAPRSFGATTFALHLLAEHTDSQTALVKLDADWSAPSKGRLPLERAHAFQLDLKDATSDRLSADFLNSLSHYAEGLAACRSYLVLTVARELWEDHYLTARNGLHVVYLKEPPDAQRVVEAHLHANGHAQLAADLRSFERARSCLRGLDAVAAVRAAGAIVMAQQEYTRRQQVHVPLLASRSARQDAEAGFEDHVTAALSDWRDQLDQLFGETTATRDESNPSLTLEDRCLLLALAVRQSALMPHVADAARSLQEALAPPGPGKPSGLSPAPTVFAGRGLRRRIHDVGATVDSHDTVLFDRPAYGRAILEYVWDNYEVMREPMLVWLAQAADGADTTDPTVDALAALALRHGTADYLNVLGAIAHSDRPELLSAVLGTAVQDEHVGRLAWAALYRWAGSKEYAPAVISTCRRVLHDPSASPSTAKMAMVRLRRIAHTTDDPDTRREVRNAFEELTRQPSGTDRLVTEVRNWQQSKRSGKSGSLAFLALMSVNYEGMPWLMSTAAPEIDVQQALQDLLSDPATAAEIIPRLTAWVRTCATDPASYTRLRDQLTPPLRGHNMFQAGMDLMQAFADVSTAQGVNVAKDFYQHLVDPRLHTVFSLKEDPA